MTNFKTIIGRVKYLRTLKNKPKAVSICLLKRENIKEREIAALRLKFDGIRKLTRVPDIIFITSLKGCQLPVHEAK